MPRNASQTVSPNVDYTAPVIDNNYPQPPSNPFAGQSLQAATASLRQPTATTQFIAAGGSAIVVLAVTSGILLLANVAVFLAQTLLNLVN